MAKNYWFLTRQKRRLTTIIETLFVYSQFCEGRVWESSLQEEYEDRLGNKEIVEHGTLRARRAGQGGGGGRTLFTQMKDLGLVFLDEQGKCRLTLIGEALVMNNIRFVEAMRLQLQRYQYPSSTRWSGSGAVNHDFKVHPFQFILRLLRDKRLENALSMKEMYGIVIHKATSDDSSVFEDVISQILQYRQGERKNFIEDTPTKTYSEIANTFFNYLFLTQYIDRGIGTISIRQGKESEVDSFIESKPTFIPNPELHENYQRKFGRGTVSKDLRKFETSNPAKTPADTMEANVRRAYILLSLERPISKITPDIVAEISYRIGVDEKIVETLLLKNYPNGNIDDFFSAYRELAFMSRSKAKEFELATCEIFKNIFGMKAEHVGNIGNTPDVFVESEEGYCGIIDTKAYKNGYSISGNHKRTMEHVYIPNYRKYGHTDAPLVFFLYIAPSFGSNINSQLSQIVRDTGVNGAVIPIDTFIEFAQSYTETNCDHKFIKKLFSLNREVRLSDLPNQSKA